MVHPYNQLSIYFRPRAPRLKKHAAAGSNVPRTNNGLQPYHRKTPSGPWHVFAWRRALPHRSFRLYGYLISPAIARKSGSDKGNQQPPQEQDCNVQVISFHRNRQHLWLLRFDSNSRRCFARGHTGFLFLDRSDVCRAAGKSGHVVLQRQRGDGGSQRGGGYSSGNGRC